MEEFNLSYQSSAAHVFDLLKAEGKKQMISEQLLKAALLLEEPLDPSPLRTRVRDFFSTAAILVPEGLDTLPTAWLVQIPVILWDSRKPHWTNIPYMVHSLAISEGVLCIAFKQELPNEEGRLTAWDRLRILLNLELRPNLWEPLPADLEKRVWEELPEMREELFRVF